MKSITGILIFAIIGFAGYEFYTSTQNPVTQEQFKTAHKTLNYKIDSIVKTQKEVINRLKRLEINQNTAINGIEKNGIDIKKLSLDNDTIIGNQEVIFNAVKNSKTNIVDELFNLWK